MIFVTDQGRLCNNIIQYGHMYAWGREHGRETMSMRFAYKYPEFHISHTRYHHILLYVVAKYAARWKLIPTVSFDDIHCDYSSKQAVLLGHKYVLARGWCVRFPDLFVKYMDEIRALFAFSDKVEKRVEERLQTAQGDCVRLGVHVRRGDYARWCGGRYFYSDEQYVAVMRQFCQLHAGKRVEIFVCSNDPKLDRRYFREQSGAAAVHFPEGTAAEDLCLLSHCDYLIGPPSTYSLVAAMYRDTPLYWVVDAQKPLRLSSFDTFDHLFRQFDGLYVEA